MKLDIYLSANNQTIPQVSVENNYEVHLSILKTFLINLSSNFVMHSYQTVQNRAESTAIIRYIYDSKQIRRIYVINKKFYQNINGIDVFSLKFYIRDKVAYCNIFLRNNCPLFRLIEISNNICHYQWNLNANFCQIETNVSQPFLMLCHMISHYPGKFSIFIQENIGNEFLSPATYKTNRKKEHSNHLHDLVKSLHGYVLIVENRRLIPKSKDEKFSGLKYQHDIEKKEIQQFCWVPSYTFDIIINYCNCIELDGTFSCCNPYTAFVLQAIYKNLGIPICLALAPTERESAFTMCYRSIELAYSKIYSKQNQLKPDMKTPDEFIRILKDKHVLSDMGTAIKSFCASEKIIQHWCFRHILENIGSNSIIGAKCQSMLYTKNIEEFSAFLLGLTLFPVDDLTEQQKQSLKRLWEKATQYDYWNQWENNSRRQLGIPTCSNHAESFHHTANEKKGNIKSCTRKLCKLIQRIEERIGLLSNKESIQYSIRDKYINLKQKMFQIIAENGSSIEDFKKNECTCRNGSYYRDLYGLPEFPCICNIGLFPNFEDVKQLDAIKFNITKGVEVDFIAKDDTGKKFNYDIEKCFPDGWNFSKSQKIHSYVERPNLHLMLSHLNPSKQFWKVERKMFCILQKVTPLSDEQLDYAIADYFQTTFKSLTDFDVDEDHLLINLQKVVENPTVPYGQLDLYVLINKNIADQKPPKAIFREIIGKIIEIISKFDEKSIPKEVTAEINMLGQKEIVNTDALDKMIAKLKLICKNCDNKYLEIALLAAMELTKNCPRI